MATSKGEKYSKGLHQDEVRDIEEIGIGKCIFEAKAVLEIEVRFSEAKVGQYLGARHTLMGLHQ